MQVSNSYILTASNITPGMVENLSQQLLQKSRRVSSIAMGKKELTQFRTLILYDTAIHSELDPQLVGGLVALLNTLTENDNNNNDRKIFRCIVYLLMENLCLRNFSIPPEKLSIYKDAKNQFMTLLYYEISHRVGTHKVLVLRLLGMAASAFCSLTLPLSPSEKEKAYQTITQVLSTTSLPSYTRSGGEGNRDADNKTLQILGCCSALRRLGRPIPTSLLQTILNIMKINNRSIVRHSSSLLMTYVAEPAEDYDLMIVLHLLTDIMKRQVAASSVLRDDLALTYLIRASRCAFNQALQKKESQGEEGEKTLLAAYEMVHEVMSLIPTAR